MGSKTSTKQKKNHSGLIVYAGLVIVSGLAGFFGADFISTHLGGEDFFLNLFVAFLGAYLAFFLQIILHEAGHLIFGLLTGYRFVSFNVFGFIWQKGPDGKLRLGRMQIAGAGGQCLMAPPEYKGGDFPFVLYNLGGALMNLLAAALFALLAGAVSLTWVKILLVMQTVVGVVSALFNGLPIPVAAIQNDGKNLLCIRQDDAARRAFWVQMSVAAAQSQGLRLKDMPEDWFAPVPEEKMDNPIVSVLAVFAANRLMDNLDFTGAEEAIRALLARETGVLGLYRMLLSCDGAVCELLAGRPGDLTDSLATKENQQLMKAMKTYPSILRTQYALALLKDQDSSNAAKHLASFEAAAKKYPYPQDVESERELIAAIQAAAPKEDA